MNRIAHNMMKKLKSAKYKLSFYNITLSYNNEDYLWNTYTDACIKLSRDGIKYLDDLMNKIEAKADYPKSGSPLYYENGFTGYYYVVFKAYLAFYRIENNSMLVDRVLLGKSDYMRILHLNFES